MNWKIFLAALGICSNLFGNELTLYDIKKTKEQECQNQYGLTLKSSNEANPNGVNASAYMLFANEKFVPFVLGNVAKNKGSLEGMLKVNGPNNLSIDLVGAASSLKHDWNASNEKSLVNGYETESSNQRTEINEGKIGLGAGKRGSIGIEFSHNPRAQNENVKNRVLHTVPGIVVKANTTTTLELNQKENRLRVNIPLYRNGTGFVNFDISSNWLNSNKSEKIMAVVNTEVAGSSTTDTTHFYSSSSLKEAVYEIKPVLSNLGVTSYASLEPLATFSNGYLAYGLNGCLTRLCENDFYSVAIANQFEPGRTTSEQSRESYANTDLGFGFFKSKKPLKGFKAVVNYLKSFYERARSVLYSEQQKEILNNLDRERFVEELYGQGVNVGLNLNRAKKPRYGLELLASNQNWYASVSGSWQEAGKSLDYGYSITLGSKGVSGMLSYGKTKGKPCFGIGFNYRK